MRGWPAKILIFTLVAAQPASAVELVCAGLYEKLEFSAKKLNPAQAATLAKIQDVFEARLNRRLAELSPEMRQEVIAKFEGLVITDKLRGGRGGVTAGRDPLEWITIPRETLGDIYLNERLQKNLYALFTTAHELEHTIDVLKVKNSRLGTLREPFRLNTFTKRSERNAFRAAHSFFEELKAEGVTLPQMVDVMVQMDPELRSHHKVIMEVVEKYVHTRKQPHWFQIYQEISELMLMDRVKADVYANARIYGANTPYREQISEQRKSALTLWTTATVLAGIASYLGYSQMDFEKAVDARAR